MRSLHSRVEQIENSMPEPGEKKVFNGLVTECQCQLHYPEKFNIVKRETLFNGLMNFFYHIPKDKDFVCDCGFDAEVVQL